jgi:hypothetical protein
MNKQIDETLLLFCLGNENEGSKAATMANWPASDWDNLVKQSIKHCIAPYLYHRLKSLRPAAVIPSDV